MTDEERIGCLEATVLKLEQKIAQMVEFMNEHVHITGFDECGSEIATLTTTAPETKLNLEDRT